MNFLLKVWRQSNATTGGKRLDYEAVNISPNRSFLRRMSKDSDDIVFRELWKGASDGSRL